MPVEEWVKLFSVQLSFLPFEHLVSMRCVLGFCGIRPLQYQLIFLNICHLLIKKF